MAAEKDGAAALVEKTLTDCGIRATAELLALLLLLLLLAVVLAVVVVVGLFLRGSTLLATLLLTLPTLLSLRTLAVSL